jgi:serine/threonine protein kinase
MKIKKKFSEYEAMYYFTMILIALHYLHQKGIIHRDLKPANILLDEISEELFILKIGDFGISKIDLQHLKKTITGSKTTPEYTAPEVIKDQEATTKVDIWALGIMLYQLVSNLKHPFET